MHHIAGALTALSAGIVAIIHARTLHSVLIGVIELARLWLIGRMLKDNRSKRTRR